MSLSKNFAAISLERANSPTKSYQASIPGRWSREPIEVLKTDIYSRFVVFDGKKEPYIEPHFVKASNLPLGRDPDFDALVQARWYEYLAEGYLKATGSKAAASSSTAVGGTVCVNTPVQLYLAYRRLARAELETHIYSKLLTKELGPALRRHFEDITRQSLPEGGLFSIVSSEVSPV